MIKTKTARVICGWCRKEFNAIKNPGKFGYGVNVCPHCARTVSASIKEPTGNIIGRKHIHRDLKDGDVV